MRRIGIVGAGAAGLAAALRLASAGAHVTVFEQNAQVGGRARSDELDGCIVDTGAQLFASGFSALWETARAAGADSLLVEAPGRDAVFRNGRLHPITYGSVSSMVRSGALPMGLKLRLGARYVPFLVAHGRQLDANDPVAAGAVALDNESVADWGERELGSDFVELLAYPLLGAYYGSAPERTSVALYHSLAKAGLDVSVFAVRGGTGALMSALADAARAQGATFRLNAAVRRIELSDTEARIILEDDAVACDAVILALPAPQVPALIALPAEVESWLAGVQFAPSAVLAAVLSEPVAADVFGVSLLRRDGALRDLVALCVPSEKEPGLVPRGKGLLICLGSPAANAELIELGEGAVDRMLAAAEHVFAGLRGRVQRAKLYRHAAGYPRFYPGYLTHLRDFPVRALPPRVRLAGDYLIAPSVEGAIRSGRRAAEALLR